MFIWDFVASTVLDNLLDWVYSQIVGFLGNFFSEMGYMGVELFELPWVQSVVLFFSQLAWALYAVGVIVACFSCGIQWASGRSVVRDTALDVLKGFLAVSLFTIVPIRLYTLAVSLQGQLSAGITGRGTSIGEVGMELIQTLTSPGGLQETMASAHFGLSPFTSPLMLIFCVVLMGYAVIKVFFANLKRGGILLIQIAVGSLYLFSVPRGYEEGFLQWMKQVIGLCLTAFLQATILTAGLMAFQDHALLGLGLMLSAGEIPRIAGTFGLDTSMRASITSAVYTAQAAVNTTRTILQTAGR